MDRGIVRVFEAWLPLLSDATRRAVRRPLAYLLGILAALRTGRGAATES